MSYSFDIADYQMENGQLQSYAWPGGYPLFYLTADEGCLCPSCVNENLKRILECDEECPDDDQWRIVGVEINYENENLPCDHCGKNIESAYVEREPGNGKKND